MSSAALLLISSAAFTFAALGASAALRSPCVYLSGNFIRARFFFPAFFAATNAAVALSRSARAASWASAYACPSNVSGSFASAAAPRTKASVGRRRATAGGPPRA